MARQSASQARPPPPTQYYLGYAYACSLPLKAPPYLRNDKISEPPFRGLFLPWRPPKSKTLLNVPPYILFYNPLFKFLRRPKRERKKTHPLFKRNLRVKSQIPPFFYNSRAGLFRTKSTPLPEILGTRMRSLRPRSGGGGAGQPGAYCIKLLTGENSGYFLPEFFPVLKSMAESC